MIFTETDNSLTLNDDGDVMVQYDVDVDTLYVCGHLFGELSDFLNLAVDNYAVLNENLMNSYVYVCALQDTKDHIKSMAVVNEVQQVGFFKRCREKADISK